MRRHVVGALVVVAVVAALRRNAVERVLSCCYDVMMCGLVVMWCVGVRISVWVCLGVRAKGKTAKQHGSRQRRSASSAAAAAARKAHKRHQSRQRGQAAADEPQRQRAHVEVERHVGRRVLVDRERRRRVLDEKVGEADLEFGDLGDFLQELTRDDVAAALERGQRDGPLDPALLLLLAFLLALGDG